MWNPGRQGEWNACGNKFLFYSRGTQVGTEQFFIRTQMPCSFFWSKYSLSCHLFQLLTCWLEIPNPIQWSAHLQPPNNSPKKQEINIFLESSSLERWWSKWLPPPRVFWGMGNSELGALWQSRLFRRRTHFFLKEGKKERVYDCYQDPKILWQSRLFRRSQQREKGDYWQLARNMISKKGEKSKKEKVCDFYQDQKMGLSSTALLWGLRTTFEDNKESRKIEKENWENSSFLLLKSKFINRNRIQGKA